MSRARFRDQRVFHVDVPAGAAGGWYFEVREGSSHGPYLTRSLAEQALADFLDRREALSRPRNEDGADGLDGG
ncbi:MAG: DUF6316 family protein [Gammaproteobacteria bacterium]|nr:DUF6316 family protein [Gammaproteobacteria bacterium]